MAVPKRKKTPSKRNMRRAHHDRVSAVTLTTCESCGEVRLPHRACPACGEYKGRRVRLPSKQAAG
ncbi:MAG: 50S ribosomal protein L32 [Deltaproteobacteria bacterium]|nr:50S ribosomal protein L32 [Deltaproteobacteria bacterium]